MIARTARPLPAPEDRVLLTLPEVAQVLGLSVSRCYTLAQEERIPGVFRVGKAVRVRPAEFWPWALGRGAGR